MKKKFPTRDEQNRLLDESRNELQKSLLLCYVVDKSNEECRKTLQHARDLQSKRNKPKRAA